MHNKVHLKQGTYAHINNFSNNPHTLSKGNLSIQQLCSEISMILKSQIEIVL
jgi:hypothetical protein